MKLYIAGPMRGIAFFNMHAFDYVKEKLIEQNHIVFSPVDFDRTIYGKDVFDLNIDGNIDNINSNLKFNLRTSLCADLKWICEHAEGIVMLSGWKNSKGALAEYHTAKALDLNIYEFDEDALKEYKE